MLDSDSQSPLPSSIITPTARETGRGGDREAESLELLKVSLCQHHQQHGSSCLVHQPVIKPLAKVPRLAAAHTFLAMGLSLCWSAKRTARQPKVSLANHEGAICDHDSSLPWEELGPNPQKFLTPSASMGHRRYWATGEQDQLHPVNKDVWITCKLGPKPPSSLWDLIILIASQNTSPKLRPL